MQQPLGPWMDQCQLEIGTSSAVDAIAIEKFKIQGNIQIIL